MISFNIFTTYRMHFVGVFIFYLHLTIICVKSPYGDLGMWTWLYLYDWNFWYGSLTLLFTFAWYSLFEGGPFHLRPVFTDRVRILLSRKTVIVACKNKLLSDFLPSKTGRSWKWIWVQNINTNKEYSSSSKSSFSNLQDIFQFFGIEITLIHQLAFLLL